MQGTNFLNTFLQAFKMEKNILAKQKKQVVQK